MKRFAAAFLILASSQAWADRVDDIVRASMEADRTPGLALALVGPDGAPEFRVYGTANLELNVPVSRDTVFRWASLTKQFTAASILLLEKEGRLKTSDSILNYVAHAPEAWRPITIQNLLNHTGGLPDRQNLFDMQRDYSLTQYVALVSSLPPKFPPGTQFEYSNPGYAMLGVIVERASGKPYPEYVREKLLVPAGMATARFYDPDELVPNRADGYRPGLNGQMNVETDRPFIYAGSGGLMGSIKDLAAWAKFVQGGGLPADVASKMQARPTLASGQVSGYGCGWFVAELAGSTILRHGGTTFGFTSSMILDTTRNRSVLLLRNGSEGQTLPLARSIYESAAWQTSLR